MGDSNLLDANTMANLIFTFTYLAIVIGFFRGLLSVFSVHGRAGKPVRAGREVEVERVVDELMYKERLVSPLVRSDRPKSASSAFKSIEGGGDGWVLLMVDVDKCGYCERAKTMLEVKGMPYREVNLTDIPTEEIDKITERYGITGVPVLFYVEGGKVLKKVELTGKRERDAIIIRGLEKIAEKVKAGEMVEKPMEAKA